MTDLKTLYEDDFAAWAQQQAEALRAAGRGSSNQLLDWENLAEEIESLGTSQRSALASHIMRIIQYLVKLEYPPRIPPRSSRGMGGGARSASPGCRLKDVSQTTQV